MRFLGYFFSGLLFTLSNASLLRAQFISITPPVIKTDFESIDATLGITFDPEPVISSGPIFTQLHYCNNGLEVWDANITGEFGTCNFRIEDGNLSSANVSTCGLTCSYSDGTITGNVETDNGTLSCTYNTTDGTLQNLEFETSVAVGGTACGLSLSFDPIQDLTIGATLPMCGVDLSAQWNPSTESWFCGIQGDITW